MKSQTCRLQRHVKGSCGLVFEIYFQVLTWVGKLWVKICIWVWQSVTIWDASIYTREPCHDIPDMQRYVSDQWSRSVLWPSDLDADMYFGSVDMWHAIINAESLVTISQTGSVLCEVALDQYDTHTCESGHEIGQLTQRRCPQRSLPILWILLIWSWV